MAKTLEVDELLYLELLDNNNFLQALRTAGVDNWEGYEEARELCNEVTPDA